MTPAATLRRPCDCTYNPPTPQLKTVHHSPTWLRSSVDHRLILQSFTSFNHFNLFQQFVFVRSNITFGLYTVTSFIFLINVMTTLLGSLKVRTTRAWHRCSTLTRRATRKRTQTDNLLLPPLGWAALTSDTEAAVSSLFCCCFYF